MLESIAAAEYTPDTVYRDYVPYVSTSKAKIERHIVQETIQRCMVSVTRYVTSVDAKLTIWQYHASELSEKNYMDYKYVKRCSDH